METKTRVVKSKPKTIRVGHGYYDLKLIRELVNTLPDGEVTLTSYAGKKPSKQWANDGIPTKVECQYPRGKFNLNATDTPVYSVEKGKVSKYRYAFKQDDDLGKYLSRLSVELPMRQGEVMLIEK